MQKYNFPVNSRVQLYRTEHNPLGGDPDRIPVKGSTGTVIRELYYNTEHKAWCVCVRWDLPRGGVWTVRCTNLKAIDADFPVPMPEAPAPIKVEEVKPKGKWDDFKKKAGGLVSYIFNGSEHPNTICFYACFGEKKFDNFSLYFHRLAGVISEDAKKYYDFLFKGSNFNDVFISKDVEDYRNAPVEFNVEGKHRLHILSAAVWCRMVWEFDSFASVWNDCVKGGVNPHYAMLVASLFRNGRLAPGDGHTPIYGMDSPVKFVTGEFATNATKMYDYNQNNSPMGCKLSKYLVEQKAVGKNQYGYVDILEWNAKKLLPFILSSQKEFGIE